MSKIKIPVFSRFSNYRDFLLNLIVLNQGERGFSHRSFAQRVKWPVSYLNDVTKGRKKLTIARVLQFAKAFDLNPLHVEKMMLWLRDAEVSAMDHQNLMGLSDLRSEEKLRAIEFYPEVLTIFEVLQWSEGRLSAVEIKKLLHLYPEISLLKIKQHLQFLEERGVILKTKNGTYDLKVKSLLWGGLNRPDSFQIEKMFQKNYGNWLNAPFAPARFHSGIIEVSDEDLPLVQEKLEQLRNQLLVLSKKTAIRKKQQGLNTNLLQFGLSFFPIIDKTKA